jgi:hypothetical protein
MQFVPQQDQERTGRKAAEDEWRLSTDGSREYHTAPIPCRAEGGMNAKYNAILRGSPLPPL